MPLRSTGPPCRRLACCTENGPSVRSMTKGAGHRPAMSAEPPHSRTPPPRRRRHGMPRAVCIASRQASAPAAGGLVHVAESSRPSAETVVRPIACSVRRTGRASRRTGCSRSTAQPYLSPPPHGRSVRNPGLVLMWWILVIAVIMSLAVFLGVLTWRSAGNPGDERFRRAHDKVRDFRRYVTGP